MGSAAAFVTEAVKNLYPQEWAELAAAVAEAGSGLDRGIQELVTWFDFDPAMKAAIMAEAARLENQSHGKDGITAGKKSGLDGLKRYARRKTA